MAPSGRGFGCRKTVHHSIAGFFSIVGILGLICLIYGNFIEWGRLKDEITETSIALFINLLLCDSRCSLLSGLALGSSMCQLYGALAHHSLLQFLHSDSVPLLQRSLVDCDLMIRDGADRILIKNDIFL